MNESKPVLIEDVSEMFKKWDAEFKAEHPFGYWLNNSLFKKKTILGNPPYWILTHPLTFISDKFGDMVDEIKWAWQRVFRGWDDRVIWSIDSWLNGIMPDILKKFKEEQHGYPGNFTDEDEYVNENGIICVKPEAKKREIEIWNKEIDKMIAGFRSANLINDYKYVGDEDYKYLKETFTKGMASFVENYFSLWD